jgi:molecular chaperone DnaJ
VSGGGFFQVRQACPVCEGSGSIITDPCVVCRGAGRVKTRTRLNLKIPKGVDTGSRLRLSGRGESGTQGGPPGDLYVVLHVRKHALFDRHGDDLSCQVPVPFDVAALGGEVDVPTIDGYARLRLAPGTESGKVFRLKGKGMPDVEGYARGDLHAVVSVQIPVRLNSRQKKAVKELADAGEEGNYPLIGEYRKLGDAFLERKQAMGR